MSDTKYCYPDTDVLINKLDIRDLDKEKLKEIMYEKNLYCYFDWNVDFNLIGVSKAARRNTKFLF